MLMSRVIRFFVVAALLLAVSLPALADRETAGFFADRGEKALQAKDASGAEDHFRRALEEDETFAPARFGLARALIAAEMRDDGVVELKLAVEELAGDPEWKSTLRKARKLLDELDRNGAALRALVDTHVEGLVALAKKWMKKDTETAVRALRSALSLRPGHAKASVMIESLGLSAKGPPRSLFDGSSMTGWMEMGPPHWKLEGGVIIGDAKDSAYIGRSEASFEGDFDVLIEARLAASHQGAPYFALVPAYDGRDANYSLGLLKGKFLFQEDVDADTERDFYNRNPPNDFEAEDWHVYELRFRGTRVIALVDGQQIAVDEERADPSGGGFIGLKVQDCRVEIRRVEVVPR